MRRQSILLLATLLCICPTTYAIHCPAAASFHHPAQGQAWQLDASDQAAWRIVSTPKSENDPATSVKPDAPVIFASFGDTDTNKYTVACTYNIGTDVAPVLISVFNKNMYTAPNNSSITNLGDGVYKCTTVASTSEKCESGTNPIYQPPAGAPEQK